MELVDISYDFNSSKEYETTLFNAGIISLYNYLLYNEIRLLTQFFNHIVLHYQKYILNVQKCK